MKIQKLRKLISECPKFHSTKQIPPASVCNIGFPGNFNLSFVESEWLNAFHGQYLDYDHDLIISKIQPCIRHQDFEIIKNDSDQRHKYLSVFEMADIGGAMSLTDGKQLNQVIQFSIETLYTFLVKTMGLSAKNLRIEYCIGGRVGKLTNNKYSFDKEIPDDLSIEHWKRLGINDNQFIQDDTRKTLLALHIYDLPTPWGYRTEILYQHRDELIDIATFEYLCYRPIYTQDKQITDLNPWEHCFVISAIGIERVLMVANGYSTIMDCDHIKSVLDSVLHSAIKKNRDEAIVFTEALRSIHRIITDCGEYKNLSKTRKQRIREFFKGLINSANNLQLELSSNTLQSLLSKNANTQPYYPELLKSVQKTTDEILSAKQRFKDDKSLKRKGV